MASEDLEKLAGRDVPELSGGVSRGREQQSPVSGEYSAAGVISIPWDVEVLGACSPVHVPQLRGAIHRGSDHQD